jgi:hypothetical protein
MINVVWKAIVGEINDIVRVQSLKFLVSRFNPDASSSNPGISRSKLRCLGLIAIAPCPTHDQCMVKGDHANTVVLTF